MFLGYPLAPNLVREDVLSGTSFADLFNTGVKCSTLSPHVYGSNAGCL